MKACPKYYILMYIIFMMFNIKLSDCKRQLILKKRLVLKKYLLIKNGMKILNKIKDYTTLERNNQKVDNNLSYKDFQIFGIMKSKK